MSSQLLPCRKAAFRHAQLTRDFKCRKKLPERPLSAALLDFDSQPFPEQLTDLPPHGISHIGQGGGLVTPGIGECDQRRGREKQRRQRRPVFFELQRLSLTGALIIPV